LKANGKILPQTKDIDQSLVLVSFLMVCLILIMAKFSSVEVSDRDSPLLDNQKQNNHPPISSSFSVKALGGFTLPPFELELRLGLRWLTVFEVASCDFNNRHS